MYEEFGISEKIEKLANEIEKELGPIFKKIDQDALYNSRKVLIAFQNNRVSDMHFGTSTGYGEGDSGRDCIERVFSEILGAEDSLVRNQFISGTHALTVSLFGLLRPGDTMLAVSRKTI